MLLPAATRYEQRGGGTETTTERRVAFSPEIRGPRVGRGAQRVGDLRRPRPPRRARARRRCARSRPARRSATRSRASCPCTRASSSCARTGDAIQWGGARLCEGGTFPTPDGRAHFPAVAPPEVDVPAGQLRASSTRRGKQFNTMVYEREGPAHRCGARRAVRGRRRRRRRSACATATASSCARDHGEMRARLHESPIRPGNVQAFFPEGNVAAARRPSRRRVGRPRLQRGRRPSRPAPGDARRPARGVRRRGRGAARRARDARSRRAPRPHRPARPVPARPRRRRRGAPGAARRRPAGAERGVGRGPGHADADDHRRARPGRRFHQLRARHPVLGHLAVRARRRRPAASALVQHGATGARYTAVRGEGAHLDRVAIAPAATTEIERAVVALSGWPPVPLRVATVPRPRFGGARAVRRRGRSSRRLPRRPPRPARAVGLPRRLLVCQEAGALVVDADGRELVALDATARRQLVAAGTKELLERLHEGTRR